MSDLHEFGHSRQRSISSTPHTHSSSEVSPSPSRRHSMGNIYQPAPGSASKVGHGPHATSGEYDMSLIGGAPLTITQAAAGVTPIAPGPAVKLAGASTGTPSTSRRRAPPLRITPAPTPRAEHVPSPTHKKARPPREHKPDDLLRSWRRGDDTQSSSPQLTQDDTKIIPKETKMSNIHYTRGRRGSIDDIVISHHTDESAANVDIATSPKKKTIPSSTSISSVSQDILSLDGYDKEQQDLLMKQLTLSPIKQEIRPPSRLARTTSGTKSASASPYITTVRPHTITPSALMLTTPTQTSTSSRVRWLLRGIILTLLSLIIWSYSSSHSAIIILFWFLLIPLSIYIIASYTTQHQITTTTTTQPSDSPLINKRIKGRRRSSNPALQNVSLRNATLSSSASTSTSTPSSPIMDVPSLLLQRKIQPISDEQRSHRTKLPNNVFHT